MTLTGIGSLIKLTDLPAVLLPPPSPTMPGLSLPTIFAAFAVIAGFTAQNITIVFWLQSSISSYSILLLCGLTFSLFFALCALAFALRTGDWTVFSISSDPIESRYLLSPFRPSGFRLSHAQILAAAGTCNALNGILIVYASSSVRTPPLIQAILQNCNVLFSVPFSKAALGDNKVYLAAEPLRAAGVVAASVLVSLSPTIAAVAQGRATGGFNGLNSLAWVAVYTAGLAPAALLAVLQQLYFIRTGALRPGVGAREQLRGTLRALLFSNIMQPIVYVALFWVDVLPWFGSSADVGDWVQVTKFSLACSLGGPFLANSAGGGGTVCAPAAPFWAWGFIFAYIVAYFGGAALNRESATFNMLCLVVVTASTALVWLIPGVNPESSTTPLWSVFTSLVLSLLGSWMWKRWEARTPAEEQFEVMRGEEGYSSLDTSDSLLLLGRAIAGAKRVNGGGEDDDGRSSYWGSVDEDK